MKRLHLPVIALLACGFLATGCGDDDTKDAKKDTSPATTQTTPSGGGSRDGEPTTPGAATKEGIESCKKAVQASGQLSEDVKKDLEEICDKAGSGDEDAAREAGVEACKKIVEGSVPAGPSREQALGSCEQARQQP